MSQFPSSNGTATRRAIRERGLIRAAVTGRRLSPALGFLCLMPATALAGSGEMPSLIQDIGYCIVLAGVLAIVFTRLNIPEVAAFLVAGIIVGPIGAGLVTDPANIETISELGLVLLLFMIGLELDFRKLMASGRVLILSGLLQYPLCVLFGMGFTKLLIWLGIGGGLLADSSYAPLYVGFVVAASSTLLVVKLFQETFQLDTVTGRVSLGILIFQDIWAITAIALLPGLENPEPGPILLSFAGIGLLGLAAALFARYIIPIGFRWVARRPEIILVAAVSWCFIVVLLGTQLDHITEILFGINMHLAVGSGMGALIAGASIASLPYSTEMTGKVGIVKDFFVTLFFVGLGMSIPMPEGTTVLVLAMLFAAAALLARYFVFYPLLCLTGLDSRNAFITSTRLAQVSEFTLVIGFLGMQLGHISGSLNSSIIFAFVITALLTPALFRQADNIHNRLSPLLGKLGIGTGTHDQTDETQGDYVIALLGFHRVTSSLLYELERSHPELMNRILVVDFNINIHDRIAAHGPHVYYGDLRNTETLQHAGVDRARIIVSSVSDNILKGVTNRQIVETARHINPGAVIIANAVELAESRHLYEAGADYVLLHRIETARALGVAIDKALAGDIAAYKSAVEAAEGPWHTRNEVL
jgi:Kef-type K+ transport system membrane component KefB/voltage-gated potassium channel Kch